MKVEKKLYQIRNVLSGNYSTINYNEIMSTILFLEKTYRKYYINNKSREEYYKDFLAGSLIEFNSVERQIYIEISNLQILDKQYEAIAKVQNILEDIDSNDLVKVLERFLENQENNITIDPISKIAIGLLEIKKEDNIIDLCSGYGLFINELNKQKNNIKVKGIEINSSVASTSRILHYLSNKTIEIINTDVLKYETEDKYNKIFIEAPFNMRINRDIKNEYSRKYNIKITNRAGDSVFILKTMELLEEGGKAFFLTTNGVLFNSQNKELRKLLIEKKYIEAIIQLPDNLLKNTAIPTSILVLSKKKNDKINMIDASRIYEKGKRKKILNNENISEILDIYEKRQFEVKLDEIIENDHLLLPKRYANNIEFENAVKIEDVAKKIFRGVQISSKELDDMQTTDDNFQYEILNVGDIGKYKIDYDNLLKINSLEGKYDRYLLKNKDFIMTIRGTKFKTAVVEIENDRKIIATGNIMVIRPDTKKINPYYLKIFLDSKIGQKLLYSIETGSIMISISMKTLENTEIPNIGIYKQKNIEEKFLAYQDELEYYKKKERDIQNKIKDIFEDEVGGF